MSMCYRCHIDVLPMSCRVYGRYVPPFKDEARTSSARRASNRTDLVSIELNNT